MSATERPRPRLKDVRFLAVCLAGFFVALLGSIPMAGPVAVLVLSRAAQKKYREALAMAIGSSLAEGLFAAFAFWGIATFLASHEAIVPVSHAVTALAFIGVGVRFMVWTPKKDDDEKKREEKSGPFFAGFGFTMINPTLVLTWSAATTLLYARGVLKQGASSLLSIPYGICAAAGVAAWWVLVTFLMRKYEDKFRKSVLQWIVRGMGAMLVGLGAWSGIELVIYFARRG